MSVAFGAVARRGPVVEIGPDRFALAAPLGVVDVALRPAGVLEVMPALSGIAGAAAPARGASLRARLLEAAAHLGRAVPGGNPDGDGRALRLVLEVGADHVVVVNPTAIAASSRSTRSPGCTRRESPARRLGAMRAEWHPRGGSVTNAVLTPADSTGRLGASARWRGAG